MPTVEQIKQFLASTVIPFVTSSLVTWLASTEVLALLHISTGSAAQAISGALVFGVTYGLAWLASHHILKGHYLPAAKADPKV